MSVNVTKLVDDARKNISHGVDTVTKAVKNTRGPRMARMWPAAWLRKMKLPKAKGVDGNERKGS